MKKKESKIRKILDRYANNYFAADWDTGEINKELSRHIEARWFDDLEEELEEYVEEEQKEKRILIHWLQNLTRKIMRRDEFKGLRGYPITHFQEKYIIKK